MPSDRFAAEPVLSAASALRGNYLMPDSVPHKVTKRADLQFMHDVVPVRLHGASADAHLRSYFLIAEPLAQHLDDFLLARRKVVERDLAVGAPRCTGCGRVRAKIKHVLDARRKERSVVADGAHGFEQVFVRI